MKYLKETTRKYISFARTGARVAVEGSEARQSPGTNLADGARGALRVPRRRCRTLVSCVSSSTRRRVRTEVIGPQVRDCPLPPQSRAPNEPHRHGGRRTGLQSQDKTS